ncbi:MAG: response regulator transcription factor [Verrucomicrobia bacterium]|nr:response regulator transcription factor [Verrucomicrobiota bacterium]MBV8277778.1 response regulator transcription factor [Verrucomicrobiota bacterium]
MKALIIDDERLARAEVRRLLDDFNWVKVVGEAENAEQALALIQSQAPDLLFLDVQMPGKTGFDLIEEIRGEMPRIIFTTAYDEFALRAFEVNALDYLMKPITPDRFAAALSRVREEPLTLANQSALRSSDQVFVRDGERCWFIPVSKIRLLESEGNYTRVRFENQSPLIYRSLSTLEQRLPAEDFFRINRQQVVNLHFIEKIETWFSHGLKVWLKGGEECEVSRRAARAFRQKLSL